jgi:sulfate adenylyltransferase
VGKAGNTSVTRELDDGERARLEALAAGLLPSVEITLPADVDELVLVDAEAVPRARVTSVGVTSLAAPTAPTYAALRLPPHSPGLPPVAVLAADPPPPEALTTTRVLLLALVGSPRPDDAAHHHRVRRWRALAQEIGAPLGLVPLPDDATDAERASVAAAYDVTLLDVPAAPAKSRSAGSVVLFSGLSGSGKSTIAAALVALLTEQQEQEQTVTLLDGDVVRTHLSKGLGFSKADRDTNVRRIGWVAAEIAKHGGLVVCAPIAPYAETRAYVRRTVETQGARFVLVHVATSLEECERRDRKGLYAKARAGLIPEFTGISDPYEAPTDAELVIDTVGVPAVDAAQTVAAYLAAP